MNNRFWLSFFILGVVFLSACKKNKKFSTKSAAESSVVNTLISIDNLKEIKRPDSIQSVNFNYLTTKSKLSFESGSQRIDNTNINLRIKKDSIIWLSVTGFGFEVARGVITQDSVRLIDKFNKNYYAFSYADLIGKYNFPLNYKLLESLLIGSLPIDEHDVSSWYQDDERIILKKQDSRIGMDLYFNPHNLEYYQFNALEQNTQNVFQVKFGDFNSVENTRFPFLSNISLEGKLKNQNDVARTLIQIQHAKIEMAEISPGFPFAVPSGYSQKR